MNATTQSPFRLIIALIVGAMLLSGCSNSSNSSSATESVADTKDGESLVIDDFPISTQSQLIFTFSDNNGSTTLASFETLFDTGSSATQTYNITAQQFDTEQWDDDSDGIRNLDELRAEPDSEPTGLASETGLSLLPVSASIELLADKTFRISWSSDNAAQYYHVLENPDGVSGYTDVSGELDASTEYYDHRVALHMRVNARYMVQACNTSGCVTSPQQLIESTLEDAIGYFKASSQEKIAAQQQ